MESNQECFGMLGWRTAFDVAEGLYRYEEVFPGLFLQCGMARQRMDFLLGFRQAERAMNRNLAMETLRSL